ncbi:MAG: hypothetical protein IKP19_09965 [Oscillospiraceae bacterium]|nr:hypothetical protein [Oscillospiraceae bacterium]
MEKETLTLVCSNCGKEIQVPADLEAFSCLYCGEKLRRDDLIVPPGKADPADLDYVKEHLFDCIRDYPDYYKNFNKKKFESSFQTYQYGIEDTYLAMDRYICALPARREELLESFAEQFLEDWKAHHSRNGKTREKEMFSNKLILAWYTVPAIRNLELSVSEDYTELLQRKFSAAYPRNTFARATYSDLASGFRKRGFCFITTAVCGYEGKPDDCAELTAFRSFRDGWLSETEDGRKLIDEYYEIAPIIVSAIDYCDDRELQYTRIRRESLEPCYEALKRGDFKGCRDTYAAMVERLKKTYLLN